MSTPVATGSTRRSLAVSAALADRVTAALPLLGVFFGLCALYGWEAWKHRTPWLFTDELELASLARSFAHTGHTMLRGEPFSFHSLYAIVTSPAWLLSPVSRAYAAAKYIGVVAMTLTIFPTYFLARLVTGSRWPALVAATGAAAIPALVYSSFLTPEPIAYPWAALCLFLIAKAFVSRGRWWIAAAVLASLVAPLVRGELAMIPATFGLVALFMLWSSEPSRRWRSRWSVADWLGWTLLVAGAAIVVSGIASEFSYQYQIMTLYRHRWVLSHALNAGGSLMIGIGILPLVAACAVLFRAPGEQPTPALRAFRCVLVAAVLTFGLYTGIKGAYNQFSFATRVWERNIIYVAPLFFVALAVWLDRRRVNRWGALAGLAFAAYLLARTPYLMQFRFSSDSPGVAILAQANRSLSFTPTDAKIALFVALAILAGLLLVTELTRLPRWSAFAAVGTAAVLTLAWNVTAEVSASAATTAFSDDFVQNIRPPMDWLEQQTHGARTVYIGQQLNDPNSESLLEFWNPSVQDVWSLDGTAIILGPGTITTPDYRQNGVLLQFHKPVFRDVYAVTEPGIEIAGTVVKRHDHRAGGGLAPWTLVRAELPLRMTGMTTGVSADGWSTEPQGTSYTRFGDGVGTLRIQVSRYLAGGARSHPYHVTVRVGTVGIDSQNQPALGRVLSIRHFTVATYDAVRTIVIQSKSRQLRVEVTVDPPLVPAQEIPGSSDRRELGAVVTYRFVPRKAAHK